LIEQRDEQCAGRALEKRDENHRDECQHEDSEMRAQVFEKSSEFFHYGKEDYST
jgi:hypothetical protein